MTKTRREFAPEFKHEAVAMLESSGRPIMQVVADCPLALVKSLQQQWREMNDPAVDDL